jgi:hypothetical protein
MHPMRKNRPAALAKELIEIPCSEEDVNNLPCFDDERAVKLAFVAAPFVASGMESGKALRLALKLINDAGFLISDIEHEVMVRGAEWTFNLDRTLESLGIKQRATLSGYLSAIEPVTGPKIWAMALKGGCVFNSELRKRLKAHQKALRANAQEQRSKGRRAKAVKKNLSVRSGPAGC